ncbi:Alkyl hydroperoxide reductase subunit C-like protein [Caballeronia glathei]|jgi:peroxiredoxin (alkyl hydroperoxide reductase subunit C)|uniref:thioredoxin-dependent peroxiredoxin n=1 Tax=Caballeronia glathei TaxID=60547 RepID=A0A069PN78_9BURK|nr:MULTISPECIES: peroxiredoxin [Burkholderiaceae]KDR38746.1 peroxiredoxin [Caballeronia glathei]TCK44214.1 peroxiredoxin [Paraburkholderia sp. BL8N3]CDY79552.1 Alkyl hydroperoxide reductase subunit C-like protein [Caballeronia glathei]
MKRNITGRMLAAAIGAGLAAYALVAFATLKPGDRAPAFVAQASLGGNVYQYSLADALKKGPVVLYFYPAAFTKGCTIEAHEFAEAVDQYQAEGATVIGVSHDNIDTLKRFSVSECRSKFPVAADAESKIIKAYDASMPMMSTMANRVSYVIAPDGTVIYEYTSLSPEKHVANTLQAVRDWNAKHKAQ